MGPEALEGPRQVGLCRDALSAAGGDDAEEHASAVSAFRAAGEEHVEAELGDVLELAFSGRVIDRDERIVDETEERVVVVLVVPNRRRQRLGRQERGKHSVAPPVEVAHDGAHVSLSMFSESVTGETELLSFLFLTV